MSPSFYKTGTLVIGIAAIVDPSPICGAILAKSCRRALRWAATTGSQLWQDGRGAVSFGDGAINITGDKENVDYHNNLNGKHTILFP